LGAPRLLLLLFPATPFGTGSRTSSTLPQHPCVLTPTPMQNRPPCTPNRTAPPMHPRRSPSAASSRPPSRSRRPTTRWPTSTGTPPWCSPRSRRGGCGRVWMSSRRRWRARRCVGVWVRGWVGGWPLGPWFFFGGVAGVGVVVVGSGVVFCTCEGGRGGWGRALGMWFGGGGVGGGV